MGRKGCLGFLTYLFRGGAGWGRGARGTGSPDPSVISNPRVYARVQLAETAVGPIAVSVMVHSGTGEVVRVVVGAGQRGVGRDLADLADLAVPECST